MGSFWLGYKLNNLLFYGYNIDSPLGMVMTAIALFCLSLLNEGLRALRISARKSVEAREIPIRYILTSQASQNDNPDEESGSSETTRLLGARRRLRRQESPQVPRACPSMLDLWMEIKETQVDRLFLALMYCLQLSVGYLVMLAVMSYSVWLCLGAVLGATLGHWFFQPELRMIANPKRGRYGATQPPSVNYGAIQDGGHEIRTDHDDILASDTRQPECSGVSDEQEALGARPKSSSATQARSHSQESVNQIVQVEVHRDHHGVEHSKSEAEDDKTSDSTETAKLSVHRVHPFDA